MLHWCSGASWGDYTRIFDKVIDPDYMLALCHLLRSPTEAALARAGKAGGSGIDIGAASQLGVGTAVAAGSRCWPHLQQQPHSTSSKSGAGAPASKGQSSSGGGAASHADDIWDDPFDTASTTTTTTSSSTPPDHHTSTAPPPVPPRPLHGPHAPTASSAWLDGMQLQPVDDAIWRNAPAGMLAGVMEEAQRQVAAQKLPKRQLSAALSKALELSRAFPSLSPRELLVGAYHGCTNVTWLGSLKGSYKRASMLTTTPPL